MAVGLAMMRDFGARPPAQPSRTRLLRNACRASSFGFFINS